MPSLVTDALSGWRCSAISSPITAPIQGAWLMLANAPGGDSDHRLDYRPGCFAIEARCRAARMTSRRPRRWTATPRFVVPAHRDFGGPSLTH